MNEDILVSRAAESFLLPSISYPRPVPSIHTHHTHIHTPHPHIPLHTYTTLPYTTHTPESRTHMPHTHTPYTPDIPHTLYVHTTAPLLHYRHHIHPHTAYTPHTLSYTYHTHPIHTHTCPLIMFQGLKFHHQSYFPLNGGLDPFKKCLRSCPRGLMCDNPERKRTFANPFLGVCSQGR